MVAAEKTETYLGAPITAGTILSGTGMKYGVYSAAKATQSDTVTFGDFTTLYFAAACTKDSATTTSAAYESVNISTTTPNQVILDAATGSATVTLYFLVIGV
jgi:hypothetical protein